MVMKFIELFQKKIQFVSNSKFFSNLHINEGKLERKVKKGFFYL